MSGIGTRAIGWIKPDDNVRPEHDAYHIGDWLAERGIPNVQAIIRTSRSTGLHEVDELCATGNVDRLLPPARDLAENGADCIAWACTSASFIGGLAWCEEQRRSIEQGIGLPTTSTSWAIVAALRNLRATEVDLLSPYPKLISDRFASFLGEAGIAVARSQSLESPSGPESFKLDLVKEVKRFAVETSDRPIVIPDTACNSLRILRSLEEAAHGRPVVTAVQATVWHSLTLVGIVPKAENAGRLFNL